MKKHLLSLLAVVVSLHVGAQTEVGSQRLTGTDADVHQTDVSKHLQADSISFQTEMMQPGIAAPGAPAVQSYTNVTKQGGAGIPLWKGAYVGFYGMTDQKPGLMTTEMGSMALHQDLGRWQITATAMANKYWMPWQRSLYTQYGVGGNVAYLLSKAVSLHAFGYYYGNQMQVGAAMSPYMNTSTYGGYADFRFSNVFGADVGVRRYVDPMTGRWETSPIISPYINIGGGKLQFPLGDILKSVVWGSEERHRQQRWKDQNPFNAPGSMGGAPAPQPSRPLVRPGARP